MSAAYAIARPPQIEELDAVNYKEIAQLMSLDGRFYDLDPNNRVTGIRSLNSWDPQRDAGFIITHRTVVAGDFDQEDGLERAFKLQRKLRYPSIVQRSGHKKGRAHIFVLVWNEDQRQHVAKEIIEAADGDETAYRDPNKHFGIRPLGALHREGQSRSINANGWTSAQILDLVKKGERPAKPIKRRPSADLHQLASESVPTGFRSARLCLIAGEAVRQGWTYEAFATLILSHPEGAGEKIAKDGTKRQDKYLRDLWSNAAKHWTPVDSKADRWTKRLFKDAHAMSSQLNLIPVVHFIANLHKITRGEFQLSIRELAGKLNCGEKRAWNCLNYLKDHGWLKEVVKGAGFYGSIYVLQFPDLETHCDKVTVSLKGGCTEGAFPFPENSTNSAHNSLTGRNAMSRTWHLLSLTQPRTAEEIGRVTGKAKSSVYCQLKRLVDIGLAVKVGKGYVRLDTGAAHADAAKLRMTEDRDVIRRARHLGQRKDRHERLMEIVAARLAAARRKATQERTQSQLRPHPATDQATQNGNKTEHLPGSKRKQNGSEFHANEGVMLGRLYKQRSN